MDMPGPNGKPVPNGIGLRVQHLDFTSHDLEGVKRFYTEVLGFTNHLLFAAHGYLTVIVTPTSSFGFMAPAPNSPPESWSPPGEPNLYFHVENVDRAYADLSAKGVSFEQPPRDMPWGHRMAVLRDPEGRRVCLAHALPK